MREHRDCQATEDCSEDSQGLLQSALFAFRHHQWHQASQTRHPFLQEQAMFGRDPYGERRPTEGEYRIVALVAQGLNNGDVARKIRTTRSVIKNRLRIIYDKLGVWNRIELVRWSAEGERTSTRRSRAFSFLRGTMIAKRRGYVGTWTFLTRPHE